MESAAASAAGERHHYRKPRVINAAPLREVLQESGRPALAERQEDLLRGSSDEPVTIYMAGDRGLLNRPSVSIVGTREASDDGKRRAARLARELVEAGIVVVSGLARGIDTVAHSRAIDCGGRTIAVIGTPLDRAYPAENAELQETIWRNHLLVSPYRLGEKTHRGSFPVRNRIMAALSDATVIVEASDTSGTLHQAAESGRLGRWLFITRAVAEDEKLRWPSQFIGKPKVAILSDVAAIVNAVAR